MTSTQPAKRDGTGVTSSDRKSTRSALPRSPDSDAIWSSRPVWAPTQSFSTREQIRASSSRSPASMPLIASMARHSATSSAADDESPDPRGTVPLI